MAEAQTPNFKMIRIYTKDASLEVPHAPEVFREQWKLGVKGPDLDINVNQIDDTTYEVVLSLTVNVGSEDKSAFIVEVFQAGIFSISGMNEQGLEHTLQVVCPNILYPYATETIDSLAVKASFPALMLQPINFEALYFNQQQQAQGASEASEEPVH